MKSKNPILCLEQGLRRAARALLLTIFAGTAVSGWGEAQPLWGFDGDLGERAATNAQVLALRETDALSSDPVVLAAIEADLNRIYAYDPSLSAAPARQTAQPGAFTVKLSAEADAEMEERTYEPWIVLQNELGPGTARRISRNQPYFWLFQLETPYNPEALVERVRAEWPNIQYPSVNGFFGDGHDLTRSKAFAWYVFSLAWGDCYAGCIHRDYRIVALEGEDRQPRELSQQQARDLLEVRDLIDRSPQSGAPGDYLQLLATASIGLKAKPQVSEPARVAWSKRPEDDTATGWMDSGNKLLLSEHSENFSHALKITHPATQFSWYVEKEVRLDTELPAFLRGDRYPDRWMKHATGWLNDTSAPWVWHQEHGWWWVHPSASNRESWIFWDRGLGWTSVDLSHYPWMYSFGEHSGWLYHLPGTQDPRLFYSRNAGGWIEIN